MAFLSKFENELGYTTNFYEIVKKKVQMLITGFFFLMSSVYRIK